MGLPAPAGAAALVTGASSGIGVAIARELAGRGYPLVLVARREELLQSLATELRAERDVEAKVIAADLSDPSERERLATEVQGSGAAVSILVNNAGFGSQGDFAHNDPNRMLEMVRVNVEAVVDLTSRFLPGMLRRGSGAIINLASTAAFQPMPGSAVYAASKSFVLSFSEATRTELRGSGVTVTAVCPGPVRTEFTDAAGMGDVETTTPDLLWMSAEEIARHAVEGAERDKRVVVPGALNRAQSIVGHHSPRAVALPLIQRIWRSTAGGATGD
ncbi:MAG: SDR family oxidoreductase [Actinomycetota bacterium]|nr:SDR family oxidoreductase [Actinomycetota bacterium]